MINKRLIGLVPKSKVYIGLKVVAMFLSLLSGIMMWVSVSFMTADFLAGTLSDKLLWKYLGVAICAVVVRIVMILFSSEMAHRSTVTVKKVLREKIYSKLAILGIKYREQFSTAEITQLSAEGVEQLEIYFANYLPQFFYAMIAPISLFILFSIWSFKTAIVLLICVPLIPISIIAVQKFAKKLLSKYWNSYASLADVFLDNLQGLTTLKVYSADQAMTDRMNTDAERFRKMTMKVLTMQLNSVTIMDFVAYGGTALGTIILGISFVRGELLFREAFVMMMLASEFFLSMRALGSFFHVAMNGMAASDKIFTLLDMPEDESGSQVPSNLEICFDKVSFSYQKKFALDNVNFEIKQGGITALVGESGSGKSTISKIIMSELKNYQGSIMIGGVELREASDEFLKKNITLVTAASYIFEGTVRSLLREACAEATDDEMIEVLKRMNIWSFVSQNGGLDMAIKERGSNLSGGQRQRLAMARAFLKNSEMYIFDEATSNIDAESEEDIVRAMYSLRGNHTVIIISHRLANVTDADNIVVLEHSKLVEQGRHKEMLLRGGVYSRLYNAQRELEDIGRLDKQQKEANNEKK